MNEPTRHLYVGWQNERDGRWYPVGRLDYNDGRYTFCYLRGAQNAQQKAGFRGIFQFPEFGRTYTSDRLFAFFRNRKLTSSRANFSDELNRLGLRDDPSALQPLDLLSRTNGRRVTDTFEVYAPPVRRDGEVELVFFTRGVRYLPDRLKKKWENTRPNPPLAIRWDEDNQYDEHALEVIDADDAVLGYVPRYYSAAFHDLLDHGAELNVELLRHNSELSFVRERFLVRLRSTPYDGWRFPQSNLYEPIQMELVEDSAVA